MSVKQKKTMEEKSQGVGIRIYNTASPKSTTTNTNTVGASLPRLNLGPKAGGSKRRAVSKGVQKTISKTSMLVNFLPTGTLLTFEMVLPSIYRTGDCSSVNTPMIYVLLGLCALSCFFFHFTDSFKGSDGKLYYGFVTTKGLAVFKPGLNEIEIPKDDKYRVGLTDLVHAVMSVMVFGAIALSDHRVTNCLFPGQQKEMDQVMESFPLMVGVICSALFLVFPTSRHGVGCMSQ